MTSSPPASPRELASGCYLWAATGDGWGYSNAGLITGRGASLLVDTLYDLRLTGEMLDGFAPLTRRAPIATVVNTHGNGDHWFGNQLVAHAQVIAAQASLADMRAVGPDPVSAKAAPATYSAQAPAATAAASRNSGAATDSAPRPRCNPATPSPSPQKASGPSATP